MAMVEGVIQSCQNPNQWGKYAINVDGTWYSTKPEWCPMKGEQGDTVRFDNGGKSYIKNLTVVAKGDGAAVAPTSTYKAKPYSNLGVELGHASNVAKDMAIATFSDEAVGSDDWYKFWIIHTEKVYKVMTKLRAKHEAGETPVPVATEAPAEVMKPLPLDAEPAPTAAPADELSDIFA